MKMVRFLLLLLTTLGLAGTAQAVPALGNLLLNAGFEDYGPVSGSGVPGLANFSSWTEKGTVRKTGDVVYAGSSAAYLGVDSDSLIQCFALPNSGTLTYGAYFRIWTNSPGPNTEQARIQVQIGNQTKAVGGSISDFPVSWHVSGDGSWSDWFLVSGSIDLQGGVARNASMNISFQSDGDPFTNPPFTKLFVDNAFAGAAGVDGNPSGVPEPDTMMLLGSGLLALAGIGRRFTRT